MSCRQTRQGVDRESSISLSGDFDKSHLVIVLFLAPYLSVSLSLSFIKYRFLWSAVDQVIDLTICFDLLSDKWCFKYGPPHPCKPLRCDDYLTAFSFLLHNLLLHSIKSSVFFFLTSLFLSFCCCQFSSRMIFALLTTLHTRRRREEKSWSSPST